MNRRLLIAVGLLGAASLGARLLVFTEGPPAAVAVALLLMSTLIVTIEGARRLTGRPFVRWQHQMAARTDGVVTGVQASDDVWAGMNRLGVDVDWEDAYERMVLAATSRSISIWRITEQDHALLELTWDRIKTTELGPPNAHGGQTIRFRLKDPDVTLDFTALQDTASKRGYIDEAPVRTIVERIRALA